MKFNCRFIFVGVARFLFRLGAACAPFSPWSGEKLEKKIREELLICTEQLLLDGNTRVIKDSAVRALRKQLAQLRSHFPADLLVLGASYALNDAYPVPTNPSLTCNLLTLVNPSRKKTAPLPALSPLLAGASAEVEHELARLVLCVHQIAVSFECSGDVKAACMHGLATSVKQLPRVTSDDKILADVLQSLKMGTLENGDLLYAINCPADGAILRAVALKIAPLMSSAEASTALTIFAEAKDKELQVSLVKVMEQLAVFPNSTKLKKQKAEFSAIPGVLLGQGVSAEKTAEIERLAKLLNDAPKGKDVVRKFVQALVAAEKQHQADMQKFGDWCESHRVRKVDLKKTVVELKTFLQAKSEQILDQMLRNCGNRIENPFWLNATVRLTVAFSKDFQIPSPIFDRLLSKIRKLVETVVENAVPGTDTTGNFKEIRKLVDLIGTMERRGEIEEELQDLKVVIDALASQSPQVVSGFGDRMRLLGATTRLCACWETAFSSKESVKTIVQKMQICSNKLLPANIEKIPSNVENSLDEETIVENLQKQSARRLLWNIATRIAKRFSGENAGHASDEELATILSEWESTRAALGRVFTGVNELEGLLVCELIRIDLRRHLVTHDSIKASSDWEKIETLLIQYPNLMNDRQKKLSDRLSHYKDLIPRIPEYSERSQQLTANEEAGYVPPPNDDWTSHIVGTDEKLAVASKRMQENWKHVTNADVRAAKLYELLLPKSPSSDPGAIAKTVIAAAILKVPLCLTFDHSKTEQLLLDIKNPASLDKCQKDSNIVKRHLHALLACQAIVNAASTPHNEHIECLAAAITSVTSKLEEFPRIHDEFEALLHPEETGMEEEDEDENEKDDEEVGRSRLRMVKSSATDILVRNQRGIVVTALIVGLLVALGAGVFLFVRLCCCCVFKKTKQYLFN